MLDPRTGKVTEYRIPATRAEDTPGALPGTHRLWVDKNDVVWFSEQWDHFLTGLDAKTGRQLKRYSFANEYTRNSSGMSNFAMDDQSFAYETSNNGELLKIDTRTGDVERFTVPEGQERRRRLRQHHHAGWPVLGGRRRKLSRPVGHEDAGVLGLPGAHAVCQLLARGDGHATATRGSPAAAAACS